MKLGQPLQVNAAVSPQLLANITRIQEIFHTWYPEFKIIPVMAKEVKPNEGNSGPGIGSFFSGGVDSFYTLLKNQETITKIIYIHGLDIWLDDVEFRNQVSRELREVANELQKPLIELETNVRQFVDAYLDWGYHSHGPVLASICHLLADEFYKVLMPATHTYQALYHWGSHPLVDPLWGSERLEIVHDGCEANRLQKITRIAQQPIALNRLRVCYENLRRGKKNLQHQYNCGACEKCLRTMVSLHLVDALGRCKTFPGRLDLERMKTIEIPRESTYAFVRQNYDRAIELGCETELAEALGASMRRFRLKQLLTATREISSLGNISPEWRELVTLKRQSLLKIMWQDHRWWMLKAICEEIVKRVDTKFLGGFVYRIYKRIGRARKTVVGFTH
jgi:hypothetical protein